MCTCSMICYLLLCLLLLYIFKNIKFKHIINAIRTLPRDLHLVTRGITVGLYFQYWMYKKYNLVHLFQNAVKRHPDKVALRCGENALTFQQVENITNQMSRYFKEECKLSRGDTVAIFLPNSELYPCFWLALSKIGVTSALINTNQMSKVLTHSLSSSQARTIIYSTAYTQGLLDLGDFLKDYKLLSVGDGEKVHGSQDVMKCISDYGKEPLTAEINKANFDDKLLYIYTSGTTGLPKAAIITHARYVLICTALKTLSGIVNEDVIYNSLPLYHTAGGAAGLGQCLVGGSTVVIRPKFSASNFWSDCIKYDCTVAQYIGELCRFLLIRPESPYDRAHKIRLFAGNGLRPQIWEQFVKRFNIKQIAEFYGSTEGNSNMINYWNRVGSIGYIPWFCKSLYPITLIKVDQETLEPIRDPRTGLCIRCDDVEPGLCVGKIINHIPTNRFNGYVDAEASKKKILENVFTKNDLFFNSGDLLVRDELGYFYFKDRTGDTFRWRGENVSTCEVEAIISNILGLKDTMVYGVEIPGVEGRAGMVAIMDEKNQLDLKLLEEGIVRDLSSYARPIFVRVINSSPMTGTFKMQKYELQTQGYDPTKISDPLYFLKGGKNYVKLDESLYNQIVNNKVSL